MGSTHLGLTEGCVLGGVLRGAFSLGEGMGVDDTAGRGHQPHFLSWLGCLGPWKQGRDETCSVLFTAPRRLRCNRSSNSTSCFTFFYVYIHSCILKWSLDPPKSHGESFSFCSACSAQIRADRHVWAQCAYKGLLFSWKMVAFLGWWWVCCM